jgi:imidazolonepropionase-like amidohydrolase
LIDGTGRPAIEDAVVVYDGARILAAGPRASTPIPAAAKRIDIAGQTVLPGLWDMHAHFEQVEQAAAYLAAGVTTVRDLGNILPFITAVRDTIDQGGGLGPRILVDGLVDGDGKLTLGTTRIDTLADVPCVIDQLVKLGCREVKVYSSIAPALVKPIADEARRRGLGITGHVPEGMTITEAVEAGLTGIEHIQFAFSAVYQRRDFEQVTPSERRRMLANIDLKSPKMQALFTALQQKQGVYDPTLALMELFQHTAAENAKNEPGLALEPRGMSDGFPGVPPEQAVESAAMFDKELAIVGELHRRGITVVAGTDITVPGHSLHREIELFVRAGFTPMEALQAATSVPARVMHLDGEVGTIAPGKRADLVLVAGNPLVDIRDIRKVAGVVTRGRLLDPTALWKLAGFTPPAAGAAHAAR